MTTPSRTWTHRNPVHIHFGVGSRAALLPLVTGQKVLVVTTRRGRAQFAADPVLGQMATDPDLVWVDSVTPNPGLAETQAEIDRLAGRVFDAIVAFGGGSAMDAAKALSAGLAAGISNRDLATLIAEPSRHLDRPFLPLHAVTTTSGTGAEVTPFATIWDHAKKKKLSLAHPRLFPATAFVDPELTHGLPRDATLSTGLDAMNQAFESLWNRNRTPLSQAAASRAILLALPALPRLAEDLGDADARGDMAEASLMAGLAISQTRTALCHSMSYPLTAHFGLSHGWACAATMAAVARHAFAADAALFDGLAQAAGLDDAAALLAHLEGLLGDLGLAESLRARIPDPDRALALIPEMFTPGRSDNFLLPVDAGLLADILSASLAISPGTPTDERT